MVVSLAATIAVVIVIVATIKIYVVRRFVPRRAVTEAVNLRTRHGLAAVAGQNRDQARFFRCTPMMRPRAMQTMWYLIFGVITAAAAVRCRQTQSRKGDVSSNGLHRVNVVLCEHGSCWRQRLPWRKCCAL